jgi:hypothetical protein
MDTALRAAEAAVKDVIEAYAMGNADSASVQARTDEVLRPFVATLAELLRNSDWDCIEESEFYDRFAQAMQGEDDREYEERLIEGLREADPVDRRSWVERLNQHHEKMGTTDGTG